MPKAEATKRLTKALEKVGITAIGSDGEVLVKAAHQHELATELEKAGYGLVLVTGAASHKDATMFKVVVAPRSIKDIINLVVPANAEAIKQKIKLDPMMRSAQMNMVAFD